MTAKVIHVLQPGQTYVVDYDLPVGSMRQRFYRAVKRYLRDNMQKDTGWSTGSVVFTQDLDFAYLVHREALEVDGKAHIWRATRVV